ncbi:MAG: TRM11 family SAM-dependent methyltransferase [Acidimicrobiales bacterium]
MTTELPLSVWPVAQRTAQGQRSGRYLGLSITHPAKMLPEIARRAITTYTEQGDLVLDPMCGIGTTLVEAIHLGRDAIGVEYEEPWADLARANVELARSQGATGQAEVVTGDARSLDAVVDPAIRGIVALVVTSPPYGASLHGQVRARAGQGLAKSHDRYSRDPANLAHQSTEKLLEGFTTILRGCQRLLRPGGFVVVTARPWRRGGELVDLPAAVLACGRAAGLLPYERNVALLAGLRGSALVPRVSFFQLEQVRKARVAGTPLLAIAHEDLLVMRKAKA